MTDQRSLPTLVSELAAHPRGEALSAFVREVALAAAARRAREPGFGALAAPFARDEADTTFGNALTALERGPTDRSERVLLGVLLARGVAASPPAGVEAEDRLASELVWLAGHRDIDVFAALDGVVGERAAGLWGALSDLIRRVDAGREPSFDRADAIVAAAALRLSTRTDVAAACGKLADEVGDPALRAVLGTRNTAAPLEPAPPALGELEPRPRGPIVTALMAVTGVLLVLRAARLIGRVALARRQPAEIEVNATSLRIRSRTEVLGKVVREAEDVVPAAGISTVTREVRYPRVGLYSGLFALALGSYVGVELLVDGARSASPSLLATGLLFVAIGIGLELAMTALWPGARGRCRLLVTSRTGRTYCVGQLDLDAADRTVARLARLTG